MFVVNKRSTAYINIIIVISPQEHVDKFASKFTQKKFQGEGTLRQTQSDNVILLVSVDGFKQNKDSFTISFIHSEKRIRKRVKKKFHIMEEVLHLLKSLTSWKKFHIIEKVPYPEKSALFMPTIYFKNCFK